MALKSTTDSYTIYKLNFMENILVFGELILSIHRSLLFKKKNFENLTASIFINLSRFHTDHNLQ